MFTIFYYQDIATVLISDQHQYCILVRQIALMKFDYLNLTENRQGDCR